MKKIMICIHNCLMAASITHTLDQTGSFLVYSICPGITGWAQINGRDCIDAGTKVALDTEYLRNFSFAMDAKIIFRTLFVMSTGDGYAEGDKLVQRTAMDAEMNDIDLTAA